MVMTKRKPKQLGQILLEQGLINNEQLEKALAAQVGLDFVDLSEHQIDPLAASLRPEQLARRYRALPVGERDGKLLVAMSDPANVFALDDIRAITNRDVQP